MKIIGLFGKSNQGKTTVLNQVIDWLINEGGEIIESEPKNPEKDNKDKCICIRYKGKLICIATGGDNQEMLDKNCQFFNQFKQNIDIAISATRSKGITCSILNAYAKDKNSTVTWLNKSVSKNKKIQIELNSIDTYLIIEFILNTACGNKEHHTLKISQSFQFEIV